MKNLLTTLRWRMNIMSGDGQTIREILNYLFMEFNLI